MKAPSIALVPAAAFVVGLGTIRLLRRRDFRRALVTGLAAIGMFVLLVGTWKLVVAAQSRPAYGQAAGVTSGVRDLREFASYVWQYYLPQLPFQNHVRFSNQTISGYPAYSVWIATGWAAFGWVTVYFPVGVYRVFLAITVAIGLGALGAGLRWLRPNWRSPALRSTALPVGVFFALATGALVGGLHWAEYQAQTRLVVPAHLRGARAVVAADRRVADRRPGGLGVRAAAGKRFERLKPAQVSGAPTRDRPPRLPSRPDPLPAGAGAALTGRAAVPAPSTARPAATRLPRNGGAGPG